MLNVSTGGLKSCIAWSATCGQLHRYTEGGTGAELPGLSDD